MPVENGIDFIETAHRAVKQFLSTEERADVTDDHHGTIVGILIETLEYIHPWQAVLDEDAIKLALAQEVLHR